MGWHPIEAFLVFGLSISTGLWSSPIITTDCICSSGQDCVLSCRYTESWTRGLTACWSGEQGRYLSKLFCVTETAEVNSTMRVIDKGGLQPGHRWPEMQRDSPTSLNLTLHFRNVSWDDSGVYYCEFPKQPAGQAWLVVQATIALQDAFGTTTGHENHPGAQGDTGPSTTSWSIPVAVVIVLIILFGLGAALWWLLRRRRFRRPDSRTFRMLRVCGSP